MNLLLDTQAFLWWSTARGKLSAAAHSACQDRTNTLIVSVVCAWEMQIKLQTGKLTLTVPLEQLIQVEQQVNNMQVLPVLLPHVIALGSLPLHHKDPFDRLIIAQATAENLSVVSSDGALRQYPITVIW
jgi:PIN domain nuclease of toxin-antitoxin system